MKRRQFLGSSIGAAVLASTLPALRGQVEAQQTKPLAREFYELRRYLLRRGPMTKQFDDFFRDAAIPAMNRLGAAPVGVFTVAVGADNPAVYVLVPHSSPESFATLYDRLASDAEYQKAGEAFTNAPATNPAYVRVESSLMVAFSGMPKLEIPKLTTEKKSRLFELRIYESHSRKANRKKIEMFNQGEIAIFRRVGVTPVFFGETLVGDRIPNLTYLVVYESTAERDKAWSTFSADPEWHKLRSQPGYADAEIVTNISNLLLRPTAYSQI